MEMKPLKRLGALAVTAALAFALVGCRGEKGDTGAAGANGANGTNGTNGTNGVNGTNGTNGTSPVANVANMTPDQWGNLALKGSITSASVVNGKPVINFKVTDAYNTPVVGLGWTAKSATAYLANYVNVSASIAKLVVGADGHAEWVNYVVTSTPTSATATPNPQKPGTDNVGTLVDNGDGTYKYTFFRDITTAQAVLDAATYSGNNKRADLGDVTYVPTLTHRVSIQISGAARGTGSNTSDASNSGVPSVNVKVPANFTYDFIPATGAAVTASDPGKMVTNVQTCNDCHTRLSMHGGGRFDPNYCSVCHTDQRKYGYAEATIAAGTFSTGTNKVNGLAEGNMVTMIHRTHAGEILTKHNYNYAGVLANETTYPMDHRNCVQCHSASKGQAQGDNWKNKPGRIACGSCHDSIDWVLGTNHPGGPAADDASCATCHNASDISGFYHVATVPPNPNNAYLGGTNNNTNASYVAGITSNLPTGAIKPTWDMKQFYINGSGQPVFIFRFLQNGARADLKTYAAGSVTEFWDNFVGGPSFYVACSLPQDGIATPADYNATASVYFKNVWNGTLSTATLSAPDSNGYYTLVMTGTKIPAGAMMVTGGIGYTYGLSSTQPLTQTNVPGYAYNVEGKKQGGLSVPAPNVWKMAATSGLPSGETSGVTSTQVAARRAIVSNAKCNSCHAALGVFTEKAYHAGQRNDAPTCVFCHTPNRTNSGWAVNIKDAVHAIHAAGKRVNKFSWEVSAGDYYWNVEYPGSPERLRSLPRGRFLQLRDLRQRQRDPEHADEHRRERHHRHPGHHQHDQGR